MFPNHTRYPAPSVVMRYNLTEIIEGIYIIRFMCHWLNSNSKVMSYVKEWMGDVSTRRRRTFRKLVQKIKICYWKKSTRVKLQWMKWISGSIKKIVWKYDFLMNRACVTITIVVIIWTSQISWVKKQSKTTIILHGIFKNVITIKFLYSKVF